VNHQAHSVASGFFSRLLEEKVEELRNDVIKTMEAVNLWQRDQQQLGAHHHDLHKKHLATSSLATEVAAAVKVLEKRVSKLEQ
jgi:hypothetical protein